MSELGYNCNKCNKTLSSKQYLRKHEERCQSLQTEQCELCHKIFSDRTSKSRHKRDKVCERNGTIINMNIHGDNNTMSNDNSTKIHIEKLIIQPFSCDTTQYLYKNPDFLRRCIFKDLSGILDLIKAKNFNHKHPENQNIHKRKNEYQFIRTYDGKEWNPKLSDDVIDQLISNMMVVLDNQIQDDLDEDTTTPMHGYQREHYINRLQNYIQLLKAVDCPIDEDLMRPSEPTKHFKKKDVYKTIEEFIKLHSDETDIFLIYNQQQEQIKDMQKQINALKKELSNRSN